MKSLAESINFWKLAIVKALGKAFVAGILSVAATLNGAEWDNFTGSQKFVAISVAIGAVWNVLDAFLSETMADLKQKKKDQTYPPFNKSDVISP